MLGLLPGIDELDPLCEDNQCLRRDNCLLFECCCWEGLGKEIGEAWRVAEVILVISDCMISFVMIGISDLWTRCVILKWDS